MGSEENAFLIILLNIAKYVTILQETLTILLSIKPKKFSQVEQYELPALLYGIL